MTALSNVLGIQQQQQNLQRGAAELQQAQQLMKERQGIQTMLQSGKDDQGNSILNESGEPDVSKLVPAISRIAPLSGQPYIQNVIKTHTDVVGLKNASIGLEANERQLISGLARSNIGTANGSKDFEKSLDPLIEKHPEIASAAGYAKGL